MSSITTTLPRLRQGQRVRLLSGALFSSYTGAFTGTIDCLEESRTTPGAWIYRVSWPASCLLPPSFGGFTWNYDHELEMAKRKVVA